jgi:O-antigen/teichoic acid export membrane protein
LQQRVIDGLSRLRPLLGASAGLFLVDSLTNAIDYIFHIVLGRQLGPADFAVFQTLNSILLVLVTVFGFFQPLLAKAMAGANSSSDLPDPARAAFRAYFWLSLVLGLVVSALFWFGRNLIGGFLNVPPAAVGLFASLMLFIVVRPVFAGTLQGLSRFIPFGLVRTTFAGGRLAFAVLLLGLGWGLRGAISALTLGALAALVLAIFFAGRDVWRPAARLAKGDLLQGLQFSAGTLVILGLYIWMINADQIWINRRFDAELAGAYAAAVLLRRAMLLFPAAVTIVFYPRVVRSLNAGQRPDRLLGLSALIIAAAIGGVTGLYALLGEPILRLTFGQAYLQALPLLVPMGGIMVGFGLTALWNQFYIAARPWPFAVLMAALAVLQWLAFGQWGYTQASVMATMALVGWLPAVVGLLLYLAKLRPTLGRSLTHG